MSAIAALLFILVPAPPAEAEPDGVAPTLQFVKWSNGNFEQTARYAVQETVIVPVLVTVNGVAETQNVPKTQVVQKVVKKIMDAKAAAVYDIDGNKIDESVWQKTLAGGAIVLVAADGNLP
jgi:hypothetical protein